MGEATTDTGSVTQTTAGRRATPRVAARSSRLLAMVVVGACVVVAVVGLMRDVGHAAGQVRNVRCAWRGQNLIVTGSLTNKTFSAHSFALTLGLALHGKDAPAGGTSSVDARGLSTVRWRVVDVDFASRAGTPVTTCSAAAALPSSDD